MLFAAAVPAEVYFPAGGLEVDRYGSIRSPILLDEGMVYSVVSDVPVMEPTDPALGAPAGADRATTRSTCSSPPTSPRGSERSLDRITAGAHDAVRPRRGRPVVDPPNTKYDLDVPRDPVGVDAVDHFLFVTRTGFCEQIATSLAVMLRTLGIATRLVTGIRPGGAQRADRATSR